jgi:hypothetical protein
MFSRWYEDPPGWHTESVDDGHGNYLLCDQKHNMLVLVCGVGDPGHAVGVFRHDSATLFPGTRFELEVGPKGNSLLVVCPERAQRTLVLAPGDAERIYDECFQAVYSDRTPIPPFTSVIAGAAGAD